MYSLDNLFLFIFSSLETTYKLENDLQDITKHEATTSMIHMYDKGMNLQNLTQKQQIQKKIVKYSRFYNILKIS